MRNFGINLGRVIKESRLSHEKHYSQNELACLLGLNGQAISNVERGLSSLHIRHIIKLSKILSVPLETFKRAMIKDYEDAITKEVFHILDLDRINTGVELREA